jgi:hypothetical protein
MWRAVFVVAADVPGGLVRQDPHPFRLLTVAVHPQMYDLEAFGTVMSGWDTFRNIARRSFFAVAKGIELSSGLDGITLSLAR